MSSLQLYRDLIPAHTVTVASDALVTQWLELASSRHDAAAWGAVFERAMIFYAAHHVERTPGVGDFLAREAGATVMQRDGDTQRQYAPSMNPTASAVDEELFATIYGKWYLALRSTRADIGPTLIGLPPSSENLTR